jgi:RNA polymerase sigma-70 factor (ECF subfamily)
MPMAPSQSQPESHGARWAAFLTTHWSVVLAAARDATPKATEALEELCRTYWYPLYAYLRRRGQSPEDAEDLVQSFFCSLLTGTSLAAVSPEKGRFRTFLLAGINHFLANEWRRATAIKHGGNLRFVPLDGPAAETLYQAEPGTDATPERLYERRCALALLDKALERLRQEAVAAGKGDLFEQLKVFITDKTDSGAYPAVAARLGMTEVAVRVAVHRLRQRYGEGLRAEIAQTVAAPAEVADELRYLLSLFG